MLRPSAISSLIWFPERRQSGFYPPGRGMKNAEQPKRRQLRRLMSEVSYDQELRSQSSQLRSPTRHSELPISILAPPFLNACRQSKQGPGPLESPCCDTERPKQTETSKLKVSGHARRRKLQRTPNTYPLRAEYCHAEIRIV